MVCDYSEESSTIERFFGSGARRISNNYFHYSRYDNLKARQYVTLYNLPTEIDSNIVSYRKQQIC